AMAVAALAALLLVAGISGTQGQPVPGPAGLLLISAVAVGLEQRAVLGIDNYCVPVAVGLLWSLLRR
ncbi:MAG: dolichol kinase, partial [Cyanobacteriota bacterium]